MAAMAATLLIASLLSTVSVQGEATCPAASAVEARLRELLPDSAGPAHVARIETIEGGVRIALFNEDGRPVASRDLETSAPCEQRAEACAVVLAVWEAELRAGTALALPAASPRAPVASRVEAATAEPPRRALRVGLDLGLGGSLAALQPAVSGAIAASFSRADSPWGARLSVVASSPRSFALGSGTVRWLRPSLTLGPTWTARGGLDLELSAQAVATLLSVAGSGFAEDSSAWGFEAGLATEARLIWTGGPVEWWLGLWAAAWPSRQTVRVSGAELTADLPWLEAALRAGVGWVAR